MATATMTIHSFEFRNASILTPGSKRQSRDADPLVFMGVRYRIRHNEGATVLFEP